MRCYRCNQLGHGAPDCKRVNEIGFTARSPFTRTEGVMPGDGGRGGAAYLAAKAKLKVATDDGEIDPRRLHGPELALYQLRESRADRGEDLAAWLARVGTQRPGGLSAAAA